MTKQTTDMRIRARMLMIWFSRGFVLWGSLFVVGFTRLDVHLWSNWALGQQCTWEKSFLWSGFAYQTIGLVPATYVLMQTARIAPEGSISKRVIKWLREFQAIFLPLPRSNPNHSMKAGSGAYIFTGYPAELAHGGSVEVRLDQLEKWHRETSARIDILEQKMTLTAKAADEAIRQASSETLAQLQRLRRFFVNIIADRVG